MFLPDQVSSLLRACLRADEQINLKNKLELDISTNEEDIGELSPPMRRIQLSYIHQ